MFRKLFFPFLLSFLAMPLLAQLPASLIPEMIIPLAEQAPQIDGVIHEDEWSQCWRGIGLMKDSQALAEREAVIWIGCDGNHLFLAMKSELPELGKLLARVKPLASAADRAAHRDDSLELWLAPGRDPVRGNRKYYQIIVNTLGAIYDVCHDPDNQQLPMQPAWRVNWQFASKVEEKYWQAEIAIPLAELEVEQDDLAYPWRLRFGRNWQQPGLQSEWAPRLGGFADLNTMCKISWVKEGALVRMLSLRTEEPAVEIELELQNRSSKELKLAADLFHRTADNPHNVLKQSYKLPARASRSLYLRDKQPRGAAFSSMLVSSADGRQTYFKRAFAWRVEKDPQRWKAAAEDIRAVNLNMAYYPSLEKIKARLDITGLENRSRVESALLQLRDSEGGLLKETQLPDFQDWSCETMMDCGELPPGKYELLALLKGEQVPKEAIRQSFVREKFDWENNSLGCYKGVVPPFTAIQADVKDKKIQTVLREYSLSDEGLWGQVLSQGEELLASDMYFDVVVDGQKYKTEASSPLRFVEQSEHELSYESAWQAGPVKANMEVLCEMDGMMKFRLGLRQSAEASLELLDLVIPLKRKYAQLLHACGPGLRSNYAGKVPQEEGLAWDSRQSGSHLIGNFIPYIWLGKEARGIAWFAESDRDWLYDDSKASQSLIHKKDESELRIHFVLKPATLKRRREIVFGLQATPTKPMPGEPQNWRNWVSRTTDEGKEPQNWRHQAAEEQQHWRNWVSRTNQRYSERAFRHFMMAGPSSWGTDAGHAFVYPANRDFSVYKLLQDTRIHGRRDLSREEAWFEVYDKSLSQEALESRKNHIRWATRNLAGQPDAAVPYTDPRAAVFNPEFATYQDEWLVSSYSSRNWDFDNPRGAIAYQVSPGKSFQDYQIWYFKKMLETFADAIYFDNTYLLSTSDPLLGAYYADDGSLRPAVDIFNMRRHLQRVQTLTWQMGKNWLASMSHMTNAQIVPINSWAGSLLDWEWKYGSEDFQQRFSRDMIRCTSLGLQTGSVPFVLGSTGIRGQIDSERRKFLLRSLLGVSLLHEIKNLGCNGILGETYARLFSFGYGAQDCQVYRYWDDDFPLKISGADAEALLLSRKGQALILLVNFDEDKLLEFELDADRLKLKTGGEFIDLENGKQLVSQTGFRGAHKIDKHDFALLLYR